MGRQRYYIRGELGGSFSEDLDDAFTDDIGKSPMLGLGVGYHIHSAVRAEFTVNFRSGFESNISEFVQFEGDVENGTFMFNTFWDIIRIGNFSPLVGVGLGMAINHADTAGSDNRLLRELEPELFGETTVDFAYQLIVGGSYRLNQNFELEIGYRYIIAGDLEYDRKGRLLGENFNIFEDSKAPEDALKLHEVFASLRYHF